MNKSSMASARVVSALCLLLLSTTARAQGLEDAEETAEGGATPGEATGTSTPTEERIRILEDQVHELTERLRQHEELPISRGITVELGGYVDFGFFVPQGNGAGFVEDFGNAAFPRFKDQYAWVFLGDILATPVNSRGEAADLGDTPGRPRFDSVNSRGAPGFLLSEANVTVRVGLGPTASMTTSLNFVPRTGADFALGDFFDLDLAQLEWVAFESPQTSFFAGKIEPAFGIEYKQRRAAQRFGITPSLAQRYTSGTQLGVKVRSKLFDEILIAALALTNGNSTTEQFHFYDEVDSNTGKTVSGRLALHLPLGEWTGTGLGTLEIGGSGQVGPQDRARDDSGLFWLVGADLEWALADFALRAEWLRGRSAGQPLDRAYGLDLRSTGYVEATWMVWPMLGVLLRADLRDAFVWLSDERAYLTKSWRLTGGLRVVVTNHVTIKAEYLANREYYGIPQIRNDIFTSSLLVAY